MKLPPAVAKIMASMSPDSLFLLFGVGEANLQKLRDSFDRNFIFLGGNEKLSSSDLEQELKQQQGQFATFGSGIGAVVGMRKINEEFTFQKMPAYSVSSKVMGEYSSMIMGAMKKSEEVRHEVSLIVSGSSSLIGGIVAVQVVRALTGVAASLRAMQGVSAGIRVARGVGTALGFAAGGGWGSFVTSVIGDVLAERAAMAAYNFWSETVYKPRAERLAFQEMAVQMFDRSRLTDDFAIYRGTLSNLSQFDGNNAYDIFNGILDSNLGTTGIPLAAYGYTHTEVANTSSQLLSSGLINSDTHEGYTAAALELGFLFGRPMEDTFAKTSRITFGSDVQVATELFEKFFMAVAGDGKLHSSYVGIVDGLIEFTGGYVQSQKFNLDGGAENLASIAQFMTPVFGRADTSAVQTAVVGMDKALMGGVDKSSRISAQIMYDSGITVSEAAKGVTSNEDTFEKLLFGLVRHTGIGADSFDGDNLSDEKSIALYRTATVGMGMSPEEYQVLVPIIRSYVHGDRPSGTEAGFLTTYRNEMARKTGTYAIMEFISEIGSGARKMTEQIFEHADIMSELDQTMRRMYSEKVPSIISSLGRLTLAVGGLVSGEPIPDPGRGFGLPAPSAAGAASAARQFASGTASFVSSGDSRFSTLSEDERAFLSSLSSLIGGAGTVTLTGIGGLPYIHRDLAPTTNYGTDVVISGSGDVYFPFERGTVTVAGPRSGRPNYGNSVGVMLSAGKVVYFSHLSEVFVNVGQTVVRGQLIGRQGATGKATGPHVDIEFRVNNAIVFNQTDILREFGGYLERERPGSGYSIPDDGVRYNDGRDDSINADILEINIEAGYYDHNQMASYIINRIEVG